MQRRPAAPRLTLRLFESDERECPQFNYRELVAREESKRRAEKQSSTNGVRPHPGANGEDDDDEDVEAMAKRFEQKYGGSSTYGKTKGRKKRDDYADIGAGYDENDSFIDNTDGYDEIIPPECDTACGGFYINSGSLEFKNVGGVSSAGEAGGDSSPLPHRKSSSNKRPLSSSESDEESSSSDEDSDGSPSEKPRREDNGKVTDSERSGEDVKKSEKSAKKRKSSREGSDGDAKKPTLEIVPKTQENPIEPSVKGSTTNVQANEASSDSRSSDSSKVKAVPSSDNHQSSDSSRDAATASTPNTVAPPTITNPVAAASPSANIPLDLPLGIQTLLQRLQIMADAHYSSRPGKLSGSEVNDIILGLEIQCKHFKLPPRYKHTVFGYAAQLLRRGKAGLLQKARKLAEDQQRTNAGRSPIEKLKGLIEKMKPTLLEQYKVESQKILAINKQIAIQNASLDDDKKVQERRLPKRRFPWNDQVRVVLHEILKNRGMDIDAGEEGVIPFLQTVILPMFPIGFVRMPTLLQQVRNAKIVHDVEETRKSLNKSAESKILDPKSKAVGDQRPAEAGARIPNDYDNSASLQKSKTPMNTVLVNINTDGSMKADIGDAKSSRLSNVSIEKVYSSSNERKSDDNSKVKTGGVITSSISSSVSISIANIATKKPDSEVSFAALQDSVIVKKVSEVSKEVENNYHSAKKISGTSPGFNNSNTVIKCLEAVCHNEDKASQNMGTIKVRSPSSLFDKGTISKIISSKNSNSDSIHKHNSEKLYPEAEKSEKVFNKPNIQDCSHLIKRKPGSLPTSSALTVTPVKPDSNKATTDAGDNFAKPHYKTDYAGQNKFGNNSAKIAPNLQNKYSDNGVNGSVNFAANEQSHPYSKIISKSGDLTISMSGDYSSHKKSADSFAPKREFAKNASVLNVDDSSSDDCVEILTDDESAANKVSSNPIANNSPIKNDASLLQSQRFSAAPAKEDRRKENHESVAENSREKWILSLAKSNVYGAAGETKTAMKKIGMFGGGGDAKKVREEDGRGDTHNSVIKDVSKADRFNNSVPEESSALTNANAKDPEREMVQDDFNRVMQDLKELQDYQVQGAHQRLCDDPNNS